MTGYATAKEIVRRSTDGESNIYARQSLDDPKDRSATSGSALKSVRPFASIVAVIAIAIATPAITSKLHLRSIRRKLG